MRHGTNKKGDENMAKRMSEEEVPYFFMSPAEYSKQTGMWVEDIKKWIREGELEGFHNKETGYYKVKVYKNEAVSRAEHEAVLQKLAKCEMIINTFLSAVDAAGIERS